MAMRDRNQLARRPKRQSALRPSRFHYTPTDPETQYTVSRTLLGDFALHWTADWLAGLFSLEDFPAEWIALVRASIRGGWHESTYAGDDASAFSCSAWDAAQWDFRSILDPSPPPLFSQVELDAAALPAPLAAILNAIERAEVVAGLDLDLSPFHAPLLLPDRDSSTL